MSFHFLFTAAFSDTCSLMSMKSPTSSWSSPPSRDLHMSTFVTTCFFPFFALASCSLTNVAKESSPMCRKMSSSKFLLCASLMRNTCAAIVNSWNVNFTDWRRQAWISGSNGVFGESATPRACTILAETGAALQSLGSYVKTSVPLALPAVFSFQSGTWPWPISSKGQTIVPQYRCPKQRKTVSVEICDKRNPGRHMLQNAPSWLHCCHRPKK